MTFFLVRLMRQVHDPTVIGIINHKIRARLWKFYRESRPVFGEDDEDDDGADSPEQPLPPLPASPAAGRPSPSPSYIMPGAYDAAPASASPRQQYSSVRQELVASGFGRILRSSGPSGQRVREDPRNEWVGPFQWQEAIAGNCRMNNDMAPQVDNHLLATATPAAPSETPNPAMSRVRRQIQEMQERVMREEAARRAEANIAQAKEQEESRRLREAEEAEEMTRLERELVGWTQRLDLGRGAHIAPQINQADSTPQHSQPPTPATTAAAPTSHPHARAIRSSRHQPQLPSPLAAQSMHDRPDPPPFGPPTAHPPYSYAAPPQYQHEYVPPTLTRSPPAQPEPAVSTNRVPHSPQVLQGLAQSVHAPTMASQLPHLFHAGPRSGPVQGPASASALSYQNLDDAEIERLAREEQANLTKLEKKKKKKKKKKLKKLEKKLEKE
ncbi:hypothetical protein DL98DRAFT_533027 [Cadophora sp. DSE1049]|nr:hypothetical protein DL98DRAFT_533027 [Cadophora sp. DSE1049]